MADLKEVDLKRLAPVNSDPNLGTFGNLSVRQTDFTCKTIELPERGNIPDKSCVNAGRYLCKYQWSEKHGCNLYHLQDVPGRGACEIHSANWAGNVDMGLFSQLLGCIAPGNMIQPIMLPDNSKTQVGITASKITLQKFETIMNGEDFWLNIYDPVPA